MNGTVISEERDETVGENHPPPCCYIERKGQLPGDHNEARDENLQRFTRRLYGIQ